QSVVAGACVGEPGPVRTPRQLGGLGPRLDIGAHELPGYDVEDMDRPGQIRERELARVGAPHRAIPESVRELRQWLRGRGGGQVTEIELVLAGRVRPVRHRTTVGTQRSL